MVKIEAPFFPVMACGDRYIHGSYNEDLKNSGGFSLEAYFSGLAGIEGLDGVPLFFPSFTVDPVKVRDMLRAYGLKVATVAYDNYSDAYWKGGSLASKDPDKRKEAVRLLKECMDITHELQGDDILVWLAHDGYDYPFEDDYVKQWNYLVEGLQEAAGYRKEIKLALEYKIKEPRTHQYVSTAAKALLLCEEINLPNLGVALDIGHAFFAGENAAESLALINRYKRLLQIHVNDCYRSADDDLVIGSVHLWETLEFFYWLERVGFNKWCIIDVWPARGNNRLALIENIKRIRYFEEAVKHLPYAEIKELQKSGKVMELLELLRFSLLKV